LSRHWAWRPNTRASRADPITASVSDDLDKNLDRNLDTEPNTTNTTKKSTIATYRHQSTQERVECRRDLGDRLPATKPWRRSCAQLQEGPG